MTLVTSGDHRVNETAPSRVSSREGDPDILKLLCCASKQATQVPDEADFAVH